MAVVGYYLCVIWFEIISNTTQEDAAQVEHPGEGEHRAGREPPGRRPQLEEVRAEGHPRGQVPKVSAPAPHNPFPADRACAQRARARAMLTLSSHVLGHFIID